MLLLIAYDIGDDKRRQAVSDLLEAHGPRVQLSVFEAEVDTPDQARQLSESLTRMIDSDDDQIRIYQLPASWERHRTIIGNRRMQERVPFLLL